MTFIQLILVVVSLALSTGQARLNGNHKAPAKGRDLEPPQADETIADSVPDAIPAGAGAAAGTPADDGTAGVIVTDSHPVTPTDTDWVHLSTDYRTAATILGYDENSWNNDEDVDSDERYWNLLNEEEKGAAVVLGYDQKTWDGEGSWSWFTPAQKEAAEFLGYNERTWNLDIEIKIDDKCWKEMKKNQQQAAVVLGFDKETWDAGEC